MHRSVLGAPFEDLAERKNVKRGITDLKINFVKFCFLYNGQKMFYIENIKIFRAKNDGITTKEHQTNVILCEPKHKRK